MTVNELISKEIEKRIIDSGIHRIILCLEKLSEENVHYKPNDNSNSINTQVLHLDGNVRQWLISTMSDAKDNRKRSAEFDPENKKTKAELIIVLQKLETDIRSVLPKITKVDLTKIQSVQCYEESNLSILVHVTEHFSYHVGQITYITKMLLDIDTAYYSGHQLENTNG